MTIVRTAACALGLFAALVAARPAAADESLEQMKREAQQLIDTLKSEIDAVRAERKALEAERRALREAPSAPAAAAPPAGEVAKKAEETERKVDVLTEELAKVKEAVVLPETKELKSIYGMGPAASKVYQQTRGLSLGGYGEAFFGETVSDTRGSRDRADALRFVLYTGYKFSDRIILNSEIEFEHATTGATASSEEGEVSLEFAYLDFLGWDWLNARAGLMLVPVGFINEIHEPVYFFGNNRPEVERFIIPTTWRELGAGIFGSPLPDLHYKAYLTTSLDAEGFSGSGIRGGRQSGNRALAETGGGSARLDWTPQQLPGFLLGASTFMGETGQNQEFDGRQVEGFFWLTDLHAQYQAYGASLRGLFAFSKLDDAGEISRELEETIGDEMQGHYLEAAYDIMPWIAPSLERQALQPFFRYERYDAQHSVAPGFTRDRSRDTTIYTVGLSYKPHPQVVLKLDYRNIELRRGDRPDDVNVGLGFVF